MKTYLKPQASCFKNNLLYGGGGEMGEGHQKVQTTSSKLSSGHVIYCSVIIVNNYIACLKVVKKVDLKCPHHKKK